MKLAIIGPSHPYKGGIVQQTTELAQRLKLAGHEVVVYSWRSQFPKLLYPGSVLADDQPEMPLFAGNKPSLSWYNLFSWRRVGKQLHNYDLVIFIWWLPTIQAPIYSMIRHYLKNVKTAVICHNVLPHEPKPADRRLAHFFLSRVDHVIVHTPEQAQLAASLTAARLSSTALPPLLPGWTQTDAKHQPGIRKHLLFFGIVRDYKGLDILLEALAAVTDIKLTVAGEFWGGSSSYESQIAKLGITDRVILRPGYIAAKDIPALFQASDALVLPYKSATGTTNVRLGFSYGVPVIASDIPALTEQIRDGVDGLLFKNDDPEALAAAIRKLYVSATLSRLQAGLPAVEVESFWQNYIKIVTEDPAD